MKKEIYSSDVNKGKYYMRFQYGCETGIIKSENIGYYFTDDGGMIGKHNAEIITKEEYDLLNKYYESIKLNNPDLYRYMDGISYMDGLNDLEKIRNEISNKLKQKQ